ncbi:hypothetical protein MKX03_015972 [Papaver bracteatum]|nr:hypothetical protein MKX03_015972 [Papaver bracteatum]
MTSSKSPNGINCWIRRQHCPCGEQKCYIRLKEEKNEEILSDFSNVDLAPPYIGQKFRTDDDAFEYYTNFAKKNGFAIRRESSKSNVDVGVYIRLLVCYRSGSLRIRRSAKPDSQRGRKSSVCGCMARMYIVKEVFGGIPQWCVKKFSNSHNHELLQDDQLRLLPAYRKIPDVYQERILSLSRYGCSVSHIMKVMQSERGKESGQLPFLDRDVRNFLQSSKKIDRENDLSELLNMCKAAKVKDVNFFYDFTMDDNAKVSSIAWSYGDSFRAYKVFGDLVVCDATYHEITYNRLLVVWMGIDNHGKTILFGCALLRDETSRSFKWALQAFLRFMQGRFPPVIVTDVDFGLKEAISSVLPNTKHVFGLWHIVSKLPSWFSYPLGPRYDEFKSEFDRLYSLVSRKDFESQWNQMLTHFGLVSNKHVSLLFSHRTSWALPYIRGYFLAQMTRTDFSKSIDAFLKGILSAQTSLESFFEQVGIAANSVRQREEKETGQIHIKTSMPIEEHASSILTPYAFRLLQTEVVLSMQCAAFETSNGVYLVRHHKNVDEGCRVSWIPKDEKVNCSCKEFEVSGVLCRHALKVLALKNYFHVPEKYLPFRWRCESSILEANSEDWSQTFHSLTSNLYSESSITKERVSYVHEELSRVLNYVRTMPANDGVPLSLECQHMNTVVDDDSSCSGCTSTGNPFQSATGEQPLKKTTVSY